MLFPVGGGTSADEQLDLWLAGGAAADAAHGATAALEPCGSGSKR